MNIRNALANRAAELHMALPKLLQHYAMERFLYRLSLTKPAEALTKLVQPRQIVCAPWRCRRATGHCNFQLQQLLKLTSWNFVSKGGRRRATG